MLIPGLLHFVLYRFEDLTIAELEALHSSEEGVKIVENMCCDLSISLYGL